MSDIILEVQHLSKKYDEAEPLKDINCTVRRGEVISVIGPSGTGKSTLLRCINRIEAPTSGRVFIKGEEMTDDPKTVRRMRREIGMVFQSFNLFSNMTVMGNLTLGPVTLLGRTEEEAREKAHELLGTVGLAGYGERWPDELSGGQKQRVAIARALAMEPELLLFDEPTSALDPRMVDEVLYVIRSLADQGNTMLVVTHEMRFAENVSSRIFYMDKGLILEDGPPQQIFHEPQHTETKAFIQRLRSWEHTIESRDIDFAAVIGEIAEFASRVFFNHRQVYALQQIFEEAVAGDLLRRDDVFPIEVSITSRDNGDDCVLEIRYRGEDHDILDTDDEYAAAILRFLADDSVHEYSGGVNRQLLTLENRLPDASAPNSR